MQPEEHEAHHKSLEDRLEQVERIVGAATNPAGAPSNPPPAQPEEVKPPTS